MAAAVAMFPQAVAESSAGVPSARGVEPQAVTVRCSYPGNAWPFNPLRGVVAAPSLGDLAAGDYVIVSGTLWQDTAHAPGVVCLPAADSIQGGATD